MNLDEPDHDPDKADDHSLLKPQLLMRSFLNIASFSVLALALHTLTGWLLAALFFPKVWERLTSVDASGDNAIVPIAMLGVWLLIMGIGCVAIGWLSARTAPFRPDQHGMILAMFLFVGCVQQVFLGTEEAILQNAAFAIVIPFAIAFGARRFVDAQFIEEGHQRERAFDSGEIDEAV